MPSDAPSDPKVEIAHVLTMDVIGYSNLLIEEQTRVLAELNRVVRETASFREAEAESRLLRLPTGDGMALVFFNAPEAPLACAMEISAAMKSDPKIRLRMGIHSGPVNQVLDVNDRSNVAGAGIDMAQRVMDCGDAGHILLSKRVADDLAPYARWNRHLHDLGECEVKHGRKISLVNFYTDKVGNPGTPAKLECAQGDPVGAHPPFAWSPAIRVALSALGALVLIGAFFLWQHRSAGLSRARVTPAPVHLPEGSAVEKSIAVLPLVDLSQGKDQEYFCDGMSEELLDALAQIPGLHVVARTSSFSFKGKNVDVAKIAQALGVQNILEGSLRRDGDRIRVTVQLINARDGFHLWSQTFERELRGVFAVQDEITRGIVDALKIKLDVAPSPRPVQNTEAYDLYLQGLYFSNKSDEASYRKALALFQQALDKDPTFGRAWTGIAEVWSYLADAYLPPLDAYAASQAAALKALAIDGRDAAAHCYLGEAKQVLDWDVKGRDEEEARAVTLDPNFADAHAFRGAALITEGDHERGMIELRQAVKLDPLSAGLSEFVCQEYTLAGALDEAIAQGRRTLQLDPNYLYFDSHLATAYREKGRFTDAIDLYSRAEQTTHSPSVGLAITYARMGRKAEAQQRLEELLKKRKETYFPADKIAMLYVALDKKEEAFRWLELAYQEHSSSLYDMVLKSEFKPLRNDPRFIDLVKRIGLDPAKAIPHETP